MSHLLKWGVAWYEVEGGTRVYQIAMSIVDIHVALGHYDFFKPVLEGEWYVSVNGSRWMGKERNGWTVVKEDNVWDGTRYGDTW